jgi:hypothetical protein
MFSPALGARRNDGHSAEIEDRVVKMLGIIGQISNDPARLQSLQKTGAIEHIAAMAGPQDKANRQAEGIDSGMNLGA